MKFKQLLTQTLLVAAGLLTGASAWASTVTETFPFNTWVTSDQYVTAGAKQDFTVSVPVSGVDTPLDMYLLPNATWDGLLRDFKGRFAVSDFKSSGSSTQGWWFQTGKLRTNARGNSDGGRQYGPFAISILNLYEGDKVTVTLCSEKTTKYLTLRSSNATVGGVAVVAGTTQHAYNGTVTYIMTADGHLDFSGPDAVMIKSVSIETEHGSESIDTNPIITAIGANYGDRTIKITSSKTNADNNTVTYYTKDGSNPTNTSTRYLGEFTVASSDIVDGKVVIKAISYKEGDTSISSGVTTYELTDVGTTLPLNAPSLSITNFEVNGCIYNPVYTFTSNQSSVIGTPVVTYSYKFADGTSTTGTTYTPKTAGRLSVTVSASGYQSTTTNLDVTDYMYDRTYYADFSTLTQGEKSGYSDYNMNKTGCSFYSFTNSFSETITLSGFSLAWAITDKYVAGIFARGGKGTITYNGSLESGSFILYSCATKDSWYPKVATTLTTEIPQYNGVYNMSVMKPIISVSPSIGADGYATFSSDYALDFEHATGVNAYYSTSVSGNSAVMTKISGTAAAGEGLFLQKTDGEISIPVVATGTTLTGNLLKATDGSNIPASTDGAYNYVFAKQDGELGFYKVATALSGVAAGKAYLHTATALSGTGARLNFTFDNETTGINNVNVNHNDNCYDLQGRRVAQPTKGLYIVNGKKVVIK